MSKRLKVFSFNLRVNTKNDGINSFDNRKGRVLECISNHKPDIIGFQEADGDMRAFLRDNLEDYTVVGCGRDKSYRGESAPIAFKKDEFELISLNTFWLSSKPNVPGSRYGFDQSRCPRVCTVARLHHVECESPFSFYNTHLDHEGKNARLLGAMQLMQHISMQNEDIILTGDFNALPDSAEIKAITESTQGLRDATALLDGTFHNYQRLTPHAKIDYIFTNAKCDESESFIIPDKAEDGIFISDHFPICAFVKID